ncbi:MAG: ATP-dependent zinc metalloprotease FtsH [Proteobacteria bacterium]|nr:ATP-dependent zinc metalloprotease FtsH [Pseudomonadota bacterium]
MNDLTKNILVFIVIIVVLLSVVQGLSGVSGPAPEKADYSEFLSQVRSGHVQRVEFENERIRYGSRQPLAYYTISPETDNNTLIGLLEDNDVQFTAQEPKSQSLIGQLLISSFPILLLIGVWIYFMRQMQGGGGGRGAMSFGKSKARLLGEDQVGVSFADVAGIDEAKAELVEIVDFLKDPSKFQRLGGRIPKGVLLVGAPGTGKTLLARAIAGEAKVPFFTISGSDFVEMFVGVGASRVRDMFEQAKKQAPCIIFIDELDAVGRHRGAGLGGGHDEREQTLNQMLVEMDGFEGNEGVIVIAATNRPDVLDPALLRPGRFDRQVVVALPDIRGRELILKVHMRKVPLDDNVRPSVIARGTPGFSGADLANLVNEAALLAARSNKRVVSMDEFEEAKDKIMMGAERRSLVMSEKEKLNTAYHEAGHAIVGFCVPEHDPVYKVTIIPRGRALGITMYLPEEDRYSTSKQQLESTISTLFGGRLAEEMVNGPERVTTGAANDIERATEIARNMVTKWGLSEKLGPLTYSEDDGEVFLGRSVTQHKQVSDVTAHAIDKAVRGIVDRNYERAKSILKEHEDKLHIMAKALMKYETLNDVQVKDIMEDREVRPPKDWDDSDDSATTGAKEDTKGETTGVIGGPASEH